MEKFSDSVSERMTLFESVMEKTSRQDVHWSQSSTANIFRVLLAFTCSVAGWMTFSLNSRSKSGRKKEIIGK